MSTAAEGARVLVIVPAYREAPVIGEVVASLLACGYDVLVVDDGSRDETGAEAEAAGATVLRHPVNLGQGAALQSGFDYALERRFDVVVTFDADGQHEASEVSMLVDRLRSSGADIVLGSRFLGSAPGMPRSRRLALRVATIFTRLTTGVPVSDTHNGLRAIRVDTLKRLRLEQARMAHASEFLREIARHKLAVVEVPVTVRYTAYSRSKGQRLRAAANILSDLAIGRLADQGRMS